MFTLASKENEESGLNVVKGIDPVFLEAAGKIASIAEKKWDDRQYLWPIPTTEIQINTNMKQNPNY